MVGDTIISSDEFSLAIDILKLLSTSDYISENELRNKLNVPKKNLKSFLFSLEYLNIIEFHKDKIRLKSNILSLLYEPLIYYEGTEYFIKNIMIKKKNDDNKFQIPAFLFPLLLIRSITPYFGLILKEIENEGLLKLSSDKKDFIINFFEPLNYLNSNKIENSKNLFFSSEEFYNIWYIVNKKLVEKINVKSTQARENIKLNKREIAIKSKTSNLDDFINMKGYDELITYYKSKYKENNLILMTKIKVDEKSLIKFINKSFYNPKNLKVFAYKDNTMK